MKNLLFSGASGFLGNHILPLIEEIYRVKTLGLTSNDNYYLNLANEIPQLSEQFDVVLHAAGKAHTVPISEIESQVFYDVNLQGTKNLCAGLEKCGVPKSFVFISSVAVYGLDFGLEITEDSPLNGTTPYALSKIQAEQFLTDWCKKQGVILSIVRPSLIAGPNPPGNLGDMIRGIKSGKYLSISGGKAQKSVLMVQDIAVLLPILAEKGGIFNVCDTKHPTFRLLDKLIAQQINKNAPLSIPYCFAKMIALCGDILGGKIPINSYKLDKITKSLTFSNEKARKELGWVPMNVLENFRIK